MPRKRNTAFRLDDLFVTAACLAGAFLSAYFFAEVLTGELRRAGEKPIATISFKYNSARRKPGDRVVWEYLRRESPVYNSDTIRTAERAEATIRFPDGRAIDLDEDTLVRVLVRESGEAEIGLDSGSLVANSGSDSGGLSVVSGKNRVALSGNAAIRARGQGSALDVRLSSGSARVETGRGSVSLAGGEGATVGEDGETRKTDGFTMTEPAEGARLPNPGKESLPVRFSWARSGDSARESLALEVSRSGDFTDIAGGGDLSGKDTLPVALTEGVWRWRVLPTATAKSEGANVAEEDVAEGSFRVINTPPPVPITPTDGMAYTYRKTPPSVRFIWSGDERADYWQLEIARDAGFSDVRASVRTTRPSATVASLEEGAWHWRVRPHYPFVPGGFIVSSRPQVFAITRGTELLAPRPIGPKPDAAVNVAKDAARATYFSWESEPEAAAYTVRLSRDASMSKPEATRKVGDNACPLSDIARELDEGTWYWSVAQSDTEGVESPASAPRAFLAVKGELVQRTVFPPDGYSIADTLAPDTRFTWKTNIPSGTRFQVAEDRGFTRIARDETATGQSTRGVTVPVGTWYWRIVARVGNATLATEPRSFTIQPPFGKPDVIAPESGKLLVVRPGIASDFSWRQIPGAHYYRLRLYRAGVSEATIDRNYVEGESLKIDANGLAEGAYRMTVQAFADETASSTRRSGTIAESFFTMRKIKPVDLLSPENGERIDGVDAILRPRSVSWRSFDPGTRARLVVSANRDDLAIDDPDNSPRIGNPALSVIAPETTVSLGRLGPGTYFWTVVARTADGIDITANEPRTFIVTPIPPLPAPAGTKPASGTLIDEGYLSRTRKATFSWEPVPGATEYRFEIRTLKGVMLVGATVTGRSFTIEDLGKLDEGKFAWTVEAKKRLEDGTLIQNGEIARSILDIALSPLLAPKGLNKKVLYGK